jgi:hypothetical protein
MAVARTNPIPPGLYWIDLFSPTSSSPTTKDGVPIFAAWARANKGRVAVVTTQEFGEPGFGGPKRTWLSFRVTSPPGAFPFGLGFPTIADDGAATTSEDTAHAPVVEQPDPLAFLHDAAFNIEGLALLFVLWQLSKGR